jgi:hypothetical protein
MRNLQELNNLLKIRPQSRVFWCVRLAVASLLLLGSFIASPVVSNVSRSAEAQTSQNSLLQAAFQPVSSGIEHHQAVRTSIPQEDGTGPWFINALRIDLKKARLLVVHALDEAVGLETVSSLALRYGAAAAVNGGYFRTVGTFRGESRGTLMLGRQLLSEPDQGRASVGFLPGGEGVVFGHLKFQGEISTNRRVHNIDGINRPVANDELIIFTPTFHRTTLTPPDGLEVAVRRGTVTAMFDLRGSTEIPRDGFVIAARGDARAWLLKNVRRGSGIKITTKLEPIEAEDAAAWKKAEDIIGGGPQLIRGGEVAITNDAEKISPAFLSDRHPRTAIGRLKSGKLLLLTVDGRQPGTSVGISLPGLTSLLLEFGAVDAINLDGGGSTTMVIQNNVVNRPSDQTGERPVSDAILVFPRP